MDERFAANIQHFVIICIKVKSVAHFAFNLFFYSIISLFTTGLSISISEGVSSGHNRKGTESDLKRDDCDRKRNGCQNGNSNR